MSDLSIHDRLFPYVYSTRKRVQNQAGFNEKILHVCNCDLKNAISKFRTYLTDPENTKVKQEFVSSLVSTGFCFGNSQNHVLKNLFLATVGAFVVGWLAMFPY